MKNGVYNLLLVGATPTLGTKFMIEVNYMEWIPCKESQPKVSGSYFVTFNWGEYVRLTDKMDYYLSGTKYRWVWDKFNHRDMTYDVVAWMPAEPYID